MRRIWEPEISKRRLRVGLLGCGRIASAVHIPVSSTLPFVDLTALADSDTSLISQAAAEIRTAQCYDDWTKLVEQADIDAVIVTLPTSLHVESAVAAFQRGLHVYVEKPLGVSCAEARTVWRAWRDSGKVGMVGFNFRFSPQVEATRQLIADGRIGAVCGTRTLFTSRRKVLPEWKKRRRDGGGALLDLASHYFDLLPWLLERRPQFVSCVLDSIETEHDACGVQLTLEGGVCSQIYASIASTEEHRLEVIGREGTIAIDLNRSDRPELYGPTLKRARWQRLSDAAEAFLSPAYWSAKLKKNVGDVSFARALSAFTKAALEGGQTRPDIGDGYRSIAVVAAAEESAQRGKTVEIDWAAHEDPAR